MMTRPPSYPERDHRRGERALPPLPRAGGGDARPPSCPPTLSYGWLGPTQRATMMTMMMMTKKTKMKMMMMMMMMMMNALMLMMVGK